MNHMSITMAIINQKGGVAKTTTALAIGSGLARRGYRVLCIDMDAQCNLSQTMRAAVTGASVFDVLTGKSSAKNAIQRTDQGDIIPSSPSLAGADAIITETGKEYRLKEAIDPIRREYDYIIIDTPPALGILTINALTAADRAIVPAQADIYSLQSIQQLNGTIETVRKYCNKSLKVSGILLTRYSRRSIVSRDLAEAAAQAAQAIGTKLYKTSIRENVAVKEAQVERMSIFDYAPSSNAASDYSCVIDEILEDRKQ